MSSRASGRRGAEQPAHRFWLRNRAMKRRRPTTVRVGAPRDLVATAEGSFARLGPPDILFFGLFLAAAARFRLRVGWTWLAMAASFGTTLALAVWLELSGLPALPLLSLGFLIPNADLIWREIRGARRRRAVTDE